MAAPSLWSQAVSSLRYRDYRLLWLGQMGHSGAMWAQMVARNWLIWDLTGSGLYLGLVNLFRAIPLLSLGLLAGVAVDRWDKRKILMASQAASLVINLALALLITTGQIQAWHVLVAALATGIDDSFNQPARTTLIPDLVPRENLMNAVSLNQAAMNTTRLAAPGLAGLMIGTLGLDVAFYATAATYIFVLAATFLMTVPSPKARVRETSLWRDLGEGFSYVAGNRTILTLLGLGLIPMLFGMPYMTLLPIFADKVLKIGPEGFGLLLSASGGGALVGAVVVAARGDFGRKGWVSLFSLVVFGLLLMAFAASRWLGLSLGLLVGVGIASTTYRAIINTLLLALTPEALHGRIMSIYLLDRGLMPLGSLLAGGLADFFSAPLALATMGALCLGATVLLAAAEPRVRRL